MDTDDLIRSPVLTSGPNWEPVTVFQARRACQIAEEYNGHDNTLTHLIASAREQFEHDTSIVCADSTFTATFDEWPDEDGFQLYAKPVRSITSITYYDTASNQQTLASSVYRLDASYKTPIVALKYNQSWPSSRGACGDIVITYAAGYATQADVPRIIQQAILLLVAEWWTYSTESIAVGSLQSQPIGYQRIVAGLGRSTYP